MPDVGDPGDVGAGQRVQQAGLAGTGHAEQGGRTAGTQVAAQLVQPAAVGGAGQQHRRGQRGLGHLVAFRLRGAGQVGLGQHDHRLGTGVPGDREHPVQPGRARRRRERDHHQHDVDVRGEHLPGGRPPAEAADQLGPAGQHLEDGRGAVRGRRAGAVVRTGPVGWVAVEEHPVAGDERHAGGHEHPDLAAVGGEPDVAGVGAGDPGRHGVGSTRGERRPALVPAQLREHVTPPADTSRAPLPSGP